MQFSDKWGCSPCDKCADLREAGSFHFVLLGNFHQLRSLSEVDEGGDYYFTLEDRTEMATFYVIPSRDGLATSLTGFLDSLFPGLAAKFTSRDELADVLIEMAESYNDLFVIFREDLDATMGLADSLQELYGASEEDKVVEITEQQDALGVASMWEMAAALQA